MRARLLTGISAAILVLGPCFASQDDARHGSKDRDDAGAQEAHRQSVVSSRTGQSPPQTIQQAIAFERFKERAAARQARIEARHPSVTNSTADRSKQQGAGDRKKDQ